MFKSYIELATRNQPSTLTPVIEKEIIHYTILAFMQKSGYLNHLVFQGGTSLRLCYGASRYSEDLDFAAGNCYHRDDFNDMADGLKKFIEKELCLETTVKTPKILSLEERDGAFVDKWQVSVLTNSKRKDLPKQRIKIELANISSHEPIKRMIKVNYQGLESFQNIIVPVESKDEILADKLLAYPISRYVRYRDIWDIAWLSQQNAKVKPELIEKKLADYSIEKSTYLVALHEKINNTLSLIQEELFSKTMIRFLPSDRVELIKQVDFQEYLNATIIEMLQVVKCSLSGNRVKNQFNL